MEAVKCVVLAIALAYCVSIATSAPAIDDSQQLAEAPTDYRSMMLVKRLREAYESQLQHLNQIEAALRHNLGLISEKKRQLEIKKRSPVQCLVNLISCW